MTSLGDGKGDRTMCKCPYGETGLCPYGETSLSPYGETSLVLKCV